MSLSNPQPTLDQNNVAISGGTISGVTLATSVSQIVNLGGGLTITSTGAIQTTGVGDGSVLGNARGTGAVDLQTSRTAATQVASGVGSFAAGAQNTASGTYSVTIGAQNTASGSQSIALGVSCVTSGSRAISAGQSCTALGQGSAAFGWSSTARYSGQLAISAGTISGSVTDSQGSFIVHRIQTTDATPTEIGSANRFVLQNDSTCIFSALITARRSDADNESAGYKLEGVIDRNTNAASTALVGTPTKTVLAEDTTAWDVNAIADTSNGALRFEVTGEAAKTIRWVAFVTVSEVVG